MMPSTEKELNLLSSYIDGQLTERERASLESRLKADAGLRADLESLRGTVALLKQAERVRVPRNFTLDPKAYGKPARPSLWETLGLSLTPLATTTSMIAVVMILGGGFVLATSTNYAMGGAAGEAAPQADVAMAPEEMPFAAGAAPAAETEAPSAETEMTQMMAEATESAPPEAASIESPPEGGAGGGITTYAPTAAAAPPSVLPSPSDNMRSGDAPSANSTTGGEEAFQPGVDASTPKMGGQEDAAGPEGPQEQLPDDASGQGGPLVFSLPLLGGGLIALGVVMLAVVLITRRK